MNRLIACALLGFGMTSLVVGCGDDDDGGGGNTAGTTTGGTSSSGTNAGGSTEAGTAGKTTAGTGGATGGSGGKPTGGTGAGGSGGDAGAPIAGGGAGGQGGSAEQVGGAGGEGGVAEPPGEPQLPTEYWLNKFCDAKAKETLNCEKSDPWTLCYDQYYGFLSAGGDGSGLCDNDDDVGTKTLGVIGAIDQVAAACGTPTTEDFSCNLAGEAVADDGACAEADAAAVALYNACFEGG